ncbi:MAG: mercury(II) reductase [Deltaproteobacteria bacterium HGW-Deltaproteobacteria-14]|jgi:mercuric reductase|nr:MAG: mercury(II) reductase [Deltaproteobacteria bacterium HGW-Deltaproteobacteria-14]
MTSTPDLLIIGSGSASFAAAIRASELGATVRMIERGALGGTCVNVGCIPSKALIRAAAAKHAIERRDFDGVRGAIASFDFAAVIAQKDQLVGALRQGKYADVLAAYPSVELARGDARVLPDGAVAVDGEVMRAGRVLIATGAHPWAPPIPGLEESGYLTSTSLMTLRALPRRLIVIGAGAIGLELAQAFQRFGSTVTVLEATAQVLPMEDVDIATALAGYLRDEGIDVRVGVEVVKVEREGDRYRVLIRHGAQTIAVEGDQLLVATGRRPNTAGLGLDAAGVELGSRGEVRVDDQLRTTRAGYFAAGDVVGEPAFVYVAAYAGRVAAENAIGELGVRLDLSVVPRVTFTDPAVASLGMTERQARDAGYRVEVASLPMEYVPRALAARDTRGLVKLVADAESKRLIGAHILAPEAGDIIQSAALAIRAGLTTEQLASMMYPYLTNAEALKLAAQTFEKSVKTLSCCAS